MPEKVNGYTIKAMLQDGAQSWDIMNSIREEASPAFQQYVPLADAQNVAQVGAGVTFNTEILNEAVNALVNRIGLTVIKSLYFRNPLAKFKKGKLEYGFSIQDIYVDIVKAHKFDAEKAESEIFGREQTNVQSLFHELNRKEFYKVTVEEDQVKTAFVSWNHFDNFLSKIIQTMFTSAEVDDFKYTKLLLDNYAAKGFYKVVKVPNPSTDPKGFVRIMKEYSNLMEFPRTDLNAMGVTQATAKENQYLFTDARVNARMDVDVLASAFNMDKVNFIGHNTMIDQFATPNVAGILVDEDFFMIYDKEFKTRNQANGQGLYINYWLHVWQVLSVSRFSNAIMFVYDDTVLPVTGAIISPALIKINRGEKLTFDLRLMTEGETIIKTADLAEVKWTFTGTDTVGTVTPDTVDPRKVELAVLAEADYGFYTLQATYTMDTGEVDGSSLPIKKVITATAQVEVGE